MKKFTVALSVAALSMSAMIAAMHNEGDVDYRPIARANGYTTIESGVLDLCVANTSSNYTTYTTPLMIPEDCPLSVYTSRYTEFNSNIKGSGALSLYCGGERTYIGTSNGSSYPDWSQFTGDVHIYPWTEVEKGAGFYGVILNHGGKRFNPDEIQVSLKSTNSQLINNRLFIHEGATLATPTGTRGVRIGELNTEAGSRIFGAIKKTSSSTPSASYIVVGHSGTDAVLAGVIRSVEDATTPLGIIKEGKGTYRITGNDNLISGAVRVTEGAVMVNNDAAAAAANHLQGGIGAVPDGMPGVYVYEGATVGGAGSIASVLDLYGNLTPGDGGTGTLTIANYAGGKKPSLRLHPTSKLYFEIASASDYDRVDIDGNIEYTNIAQDFQPSDRLPIVYLMPAPDCALSVGDEFTLICASSKAAIGDVDWHLRVQYPKSYTWEVAEIEDAEAYRLVARVVSLDYSGQGDVNVDDDNNDNPDDPDDDGFDETTDPTPLRTYATGVDKLVGVAVSTWRINNFDNDKTPEILTITDEFNAIVAENEMKWEVLQPVRNLFEYNDGDRIVSLAERHGMYVRGHALAWHKQLPSWLSADGGVKNTNNFSRDVLLFILNKHITNVLGHYKGKVKEWDVVNECLSDVQSSLRTDPDAYDLRSSIWSTGIGEDFIDSAFVYAHRADPDALLILNDYDVEFNGNAKTQAMFNLAKRLKESGIPIHGVGLQCHLDAGTFDAKRIAATIDKYAEIGLSCIITELDLGISGTSVEELEAQARDYGAIASIVATNPNCRGMVVWGFSDDMSWRSSAPLLFDGSHQKKPAYYKVHAAFRRAFAALGISDIFVDYQSEVSAVRYFDLSGQEVSSRAHGLVIEVSEMTDGSVRTRKILK